MRKIALLLVFAMSLLACNNTPAPVGDFSLSAAPLSVQRGGQGTSAITLTATGGFSEAVVFSLNNLPTGVTGSIATNPNAAQISVAQNVAAGVYNLTVQGQAGNRTRSATLVLTVTEPPLVRSLLPADFKNGEAVVELANVGPNETVVVIPVHASQANTPDGMQFSLNVSGITPVTRPPQNPEASGIARTSNPKVAHLEFMQQQQALLRLLRQNRVQPLSAKVRSTAFDRCPGPYTVGSKQCKFFVFDAVGQSEIQATLRYESPGAYWFVQNEDIPEFSNADLQESARIYETYLRTSNRRYFGDTLDLDGNGKIFILFSRKLAEIGALGYVYGVDFFPDAEVAQFGVRSNEADIFYATTPSAAGESKAEFFGKTLPATMVHELKHLIMYSIRIPKNVDIEDPWSEEASAMAAEELSDYGSSIGGIQGYARFSLAMPQNFRVVYQSRPSAADEGLSIYGYNMLLLWRMAELVGHDNFWKKYINNDLIGIANLQDTAGKPFALSMLDWAATMLLDNTGLVPELEYQKQNLRDGSWVNLGFQGLTNTSGVARSMAYYVGRGTGANARIVIQSQAPQPYAIVMRFTGGLSWAVSKTVSGTITAPGSLSGARIRVCAIENGQCNPASINTRNIFLKAGTSSATYSLMVPAVPGLQYEVRGSKDIDGDGDNDWEYTYPIKISPPATGIDLNLLAK